MIALRLRPEVLARVDDLAAANGLSRAAMVETLIMRARTPKTR